MAYGNYSSTGYRPGYSTGFASATPIPGAMPRRRVIIIPTPAPETTSASSGGFFSQLFSWKGFAVLGALAGSVFLLARGLGGSAKKVAKKTSGAVRSQLDKEVRNEAATKIQSAFRGFQARQQLKSEKQAATKIQSAFRGFQARQQVKAMKAQALPSVPQVTEVDKVRARLVENEAATKIQSAFRGFQAREQVKREKAATTLQASIRGFQARQQLKREKQAATKIQSAFRGFQARKVFAKSMKETELKKLEALFIQETRRDISDKGVTRLTALREKYPAHYEMLCEKQFVDFFPTALKKGSEKRLPVILGEKLELYREAFKNEEHLLARLNLREYKALSRLQNNPAYVFTEANRHRMQELKAALTERRNTLQSQYDNSSYWLTPSWFRTSAVERLTPEQSTLLEKLKKWVID